jgi:hypothetical protein
MYPNTAGSLSMKIQPSLSSEGFHLPDSRVSKNEPGTLVNVSRVVSNLVPPTFNTRASDAGIASTLAVVLLDDKSVSRT